MTQAKMMTLAFGWWGIPFGIIYTIGALAESSEGKIPTEPNAAYLKALGLYFLQIGNKIDARRSWTASLGLIPDTKLQEARDGLPEIIDAKPINHAPVLEVVSDIPDPSSGSDATERLTTSQPQRFSRRFRTGGFCGVIVGIFITLLLVAVCISAIFFLFLFQSQNHFRQY